MADGKRTSRKDPFGEFIRKATAARAGLMDAGESAACLWWASLSPTERELMHGFGEAQDLRSGIPFGCRVLQAKTMPLTQRDKDIAEDRVRFADEWWASLSPTKCSKLELALELKDFCGQNRSAEETKEQRRKRWADDVWHALSVGDRFTLAYGSLRDGQHD